ncbi:hypothetical protein D6810_00575 [Candidatus Dojkabacteria bacterium]|uniref:Glycosyltransferase n=1 Tax=Candidatus Dojkabacteria bacterium TaxID=2099670 RepID=A0A3M0YZR4_9BACT|nr:MAG: hypothetical protein D6810_00575 [Candidatus Dojkabacteria bacterium]
MKRIVIDLTFIYDRKASGGTLHYGKNLIKKLLDILVDNESVEVFLLGFKTLTLNMFDLGFTNLELQALSMKKDLRFVSLGISPAKVPNKKVSNMIDKAIKSLDPDLFFTINTKNKLPGQNNPRLKKVISVLDLFPLVTRYSKVLRPTIFFKNGVKESLLTADIIFLPSEQVKRTATSIFNYENKFVVCNPGVDPKFFFEKENFPDERKIYIQNVYNLPERYYFFNNSLSVKEDRSALKKFLEMVAVYKKIHTSLPEKLVIVGREFKKSVDGKITPKTEGAEIFVKEVKKLGLLDMLITTDSVSDEIYNDLLYFSTAVFSLSSPFKFNNVILQSMAAKVPIITNLVDQSVDITEGNSFAYIDFKRSDFDWKGFFSDLGELLSNVDDNPKIHNARNIARKFNWNATAGIIWDQIKQLLDITSRSEYI